MTIEQYLASINQRFKLGNATEHTFRGDLQQLIESLVPSIRATNEPKRQSCGAPDYILTRKDIPVGFIEAKDIGDPDLDGLKKTGNKEQFDRYKGSLDNLIFTDYLNFHLYRDGVFVMKVSIAEITPKGIMPIPTNFASFQNMLVEFCTHVGQTIKSSQKLAELMASKARLLSEVIGRALTSDESNHEDSTLKEQMMAFREILIHDIQPREFADVYAQTIAYGMFAARVHDPTLPTFSRQEAAELIPKSNPFLRRLFGYIAGPDIDDRIKWIVDSLAEIFLACNVVDLLKNYGRSTKMEDPIIHFYETFLSEYDPKLRKARGVWYTPQPVVQFIVRAVDDILKTEFGLAQGLADTSKTKIKVDIQGKKVEKEVHRVQVLDPATGTGTFLAEVIKYVHKLFEGQQGIWSNYVENHLLPRLNGFELLMASYAMAHLQLDLLLTETGFQPTANQRFKIYLTNSLEESHPDTGTLFANWLSTEANEANQIKRDTPVMCVIGNPPYSGESTNKGDWIMRLMEDYKKEPGGVEKLKERNPKWINDDYVKFIRYGQHFIEKNGNGVLAYINPHGFLDNPTFRGMRWNLLKTFDKIYSIDLHGNSTKKESAPDGSVDENVFDIQQGVSINFLIKTGKKSEKELGKAFSFDLYGKREHKYKVLSANKMGDFNFNEITNNGPDFFLVPKDFDLESEYSQGFSVLELFEINSLGIATARDKFTIHDDKTRLSATIEHFITLADEEARSKFDLGKDARDWQVSYARADLMKHYPERGVVTEIAYRPFDHKWTFFSGKSKGFHCFPRENVMKHLLRDNFAINFVRRSRSDGFLTPFITEGIVDKSIISTLDNANTFPLYLYNDSKGQQLIDGKDTRRPNIQLEIVEAFSTKIGLKFSSEENDLVDAFLPIDLLDYVYAVLHSQKYITRFKEFLKIDFPKVPFPNSKDTFIELVNVGTKLRKLHLMQSDSLGSLITKYPISGPNFVESVQYNDGKVYINETQYFDNVPAITWEFFIGGYQPAQKWLKDRKGRKLEFEEILHYQKIIKALAETHRLMQEIDKIPFM